MKNQASPATTTLTQGALAGAILLASMGTSIATVTLPSLARLFATGVQQVQWVMLAYLLAVSAVIVIAGRMGDLYGNRRVLLAGILLFTLASAACALAPSLGWLIAGRTVQGLGAAVLMSLPLSLAKALLGNERLGRSMGLLGAMSALGTAIGPSIGGVLIEAFGWRSAFVLLTLCGAGLLVLALAGIGKAAGAGAVTKGIDWRACFWLAIALSGFALAAGGSSTGIPIEPWALLVLSVAALLLFIRAERTTATPLVPLALVRTRGIAMALGMNLLIGAIMMSTLVIGPLFLSFGLGLSETETGLAMAAGPVAAALSGVPAGSVTDRFGANRTRLAGLLLATAGLCAFAVLPTLLDVPGYIAAMVLMTPGFQLFLAANSTAAMNLMAQEHQGLLSGLLGLSRNLGFISGAALLPLLFASLLSSQRLSDNAMQDISQAFSATFLSAAALCLLASLLAARGLRSRASAATPIRH